MIIIYKDKKKNDKKELIELFNEIVSWAKQNSIVHRNLFTTMKKSAPFVNRKKM